MVDFIVVEFGCCLLGYLFVIDFGIFCVDFLGIFGIGDCNIVDGIFVGGFKVKYFSVF